MKNLSRHLVQVHKEYGKRREAYISLANKSSKNQDPLSNAWQPGALKTAQKECGLCKKHLNRIDAHLVAKHGLKRGSTKFKAALADVSV